MTHTHHVSLLAFALNQPIGVDVEALTARINLRAFAHTFCAPEELQHLEQLPPSYHRSELLRRWVGKEPVLKALGMGLTMDMREIVIEFATETAAWAGDMGTLPQGKSIRGQ